MSRCTLSRCTFLSVPMSQSSSKEVRYKFYNLAQGPKRQETKKKMKIGGPEVKSVDFEAETLSVLGTIYKNKQTNTFVEKSVRHVSHDISTGQPHRPDK